MDEYAGGADRVARLNCLKARDVFPVDGCLDKPVWKGAEKSGRFVDLVTGGPSLLDTRAAALWDEKALYIAFWIEEPEVRASFTGRDSLVWYDNDVEFFIDGEDCYYECEINAFNTVYEAFFVYQDALVKGSRFEQGGFDLYSRNVDVLSGFQDAARFRKHRRGRRWAFMDFDFPGMESAVRVDGKINDPSHVDRGWTVELAFPWEGFRILSPSGNFPPQAGDSIRCQFFRFENLRANGRELAGAGWALNGHGAYDSHIPERFARLYFVE
ncbi:MAG: carbohydrate-binding family 9-like protein [Treponema sp.]|jgi:hypothetical protein|nr:carbohydrate-binding family 9-like protein [Treponema sp.]